MRWKAAGKPDIYLKGPHTDSLIYKTHLSSGGGVTTQEVAETYGERLKGFWAKDVEPAVIVRVRSQPHM